MAKVDLHHFDRDLAFINGVETGVNMVKKIFELSTDTRETIFDSVLVSDILDRYNFAEISEMLRGIE